MIYKLTADLTEEAKKAITEFDLSDPVSEVYIQFDDDEPICIGHLNEGQDFVIQLTGGVDGNLIGFVHGSRSFKFLIKNINK